ncbi:MAG: bifunctional [glutamine synthetase] adenylyltransferase/[glutamine synthetase]-adenylyl-L-tyrosine phosphorylase [Alphaproteobacteria bacterium]
MQFIDLIKKSPLVFETQQAREALKSVMDLNEGTISSFVRVPLGNDFLLGVFGGSPFLAQASRVRPSTLAHVLNEGPEASFNDCLKAFNESMNIMNQRQFMSALRKARTSTALTVGLADLGGVWNTLKTTRHLSEAADAAISAAVNWLFIDGFRRKIFTSAEPSGLIVLGMGKLGAWELNYSSDIDLILLYDPDKIPISNLDSIQNEMTRFARGLAQLLEERTSDGYVHRTDLRLRPDPASTPPAISVETAAVYYESIGQNWERAAMIKARPVAGDIEAGQSFLASLRPFIWRRTLDFHAIRDIQSIKRQIDRRGGYKPLSVEGHDVKLGRGGIREVEFFAQTQQLIWGGRNPSLRSSSTVDALQSLNAVGLITPLTCKEMSDCYLKLRDIEHRLQMVDDRQTHTIPELSGIEKFSRFAGYQDVNDFCTDLLNTLQTIERNFAELFPDQEGLGGITGGALVFTGNEDHPETINTLLEMGFASPSRVIGIIRSWHHGRVRASRAPRAREILTELTPVLLMEFSKAPNPDVAFLALDGFVQKLPEGVQFFSLLQSNPHLMAFLARVLGQSPYLANLISHRPNVLDVVLTDEFEKAPGNKNALEAQLEQEISDVDDFQDLLDSCRRWLNDLRLRLGVQTLEGHLEPRNSSVALSDAADIICSKLLSSIMNDFSDQHGDPPGTFAIIAYGKWGSQELSIGSDLDLVAVYDAPMDAISLGRKPLSAPVYFMRLTQRLVSALNVPTAEGRLFEVDLRLRPLGSEGPLAAQFESFEKYLMGSAWTWEWMALSRARPAIGDQKLLQQFEELRARTLRAASARPRLFSDVIEMRTRILSEKGRGGVWDIKQRSGGLIDLEFLTQALVLVHGENNDVLASRSPWEQARAFRSLNGCLNTKELLKAAEFWQKLQWLLQLVGHDEVVGDEILHKETQQVLVKALGLEDYEELAHIREEISAAVAAAFETHIVGREAS